MDVNSPVSSIPDTIKQYAGVIAACRSLFLKKTQDYGSAWRILRLPSITDQLYIKAQRIRTIQEKGVQLVDDDTTGEFVGIINYCIMALIQLHLPTHAPLELDADELAGYYDAEVSRTLDLLTRKNHDYGEAWRQMRISSITDIILMKLLRIKQIEDNQGKTLVSEGSDAGYRDMLNYAVFCLILSGYPRP